MGGKGRACKYPEACSAAPEGFSVAWSHTVGGLRGGKAQFTEALDASGEQRAEEQPQIKNKPPTTPAKKGVFVPKEPCERVHT